MSFHSKIISAGLANACEQPVFDTKRNGLDNQAKGKGGGILDIYAKPSK